MIELWYEEAERYGALPLATADLARFHVERPTISGPRQQFVYQASAAPIPFAASPQVYNRPHSITADVVVPESGADGVLLAHGNRHGGYSFFLKDGYLNHVHNYLGKKWFRVSSPDPVPTGEVSLRFEFEPTGEPDFTVGKGSPGRSQLYVDEQLVASVDFPYTVPATFGIIGATAGRDGTDSVSPHDYTAPNHFTGEITSVTLDVSGELIVDTETELQRLMTQQ